MNLTCFYDAEKDIIKVQTNSNYVRKVFLFIHASQLVCLYSVRHFPNGRWNLVFWVHRTLNLIKNRNRFSVYSDERTRKNTFHIEIHPWRAITCLYLRQ